MTDDVKKDMDSLLTKYNVYLEKINEKSGEVVRLIVNYPNLGELIFNELEYHFLTTYDNEEIYSYNGSFYQPDGKEIIKGWVERILEDFTTEDSKKEVVGYIRDKNYKKREIFDPDSNLLNLKNGVFNLKTGEFTEHKPEYYFLSELPIAYDKKAKIKKLKEFFGQVVRKEDIPLLQEIFGYCLYRSYIIQKAVMFLGDGNNGKSTVLSVLKIFLSQKNVSGVALQDLDTSRFASAELYNKLANIYPDITDTALHQTGRFKMLTGGDLIGAEKKFKERFNFVNHAKLIFSANKLPEAKDDTDAYFRRWIIINFPNTFEGSKCDPKILEKITTEKEISGLFNWAIIGLRRLLRNKAFTNTVTTDEMRETYQRLASPIASFVMDCIQINPDFYVSKDDLYDAFREYCEKNNLISMAKNTFGTKLHEKVRVRDYKATIEEKRVHCWAGIGFNDMSRLSNMSIYRHYFISQDTHAGESKSKKKGGLLDQLGHTEETLDNYRSDEVLCG